MYKLTSLKNECERGTYRPPAQIGLGMIQQPSVHHQPHSQNIRVRITKMTHHFVNTMVI